MTTAQEIERARDAAYESRELARARMGLHPEYAYSLCQAFHDHVYLPMMCRLIADAREKGLLPNETL